MENLHTSILTIKALKIVILIAIVLAVFLIKLASIRSKKRIVYYEDNYATEVEKEKIKKSIEEYTKQLETAQTNEQKAELYCLRSKAYYSLGLHSQAMEDINAAIALCP